MERRDRRAKFRLDDGAVPRERLGPGRRLGESRGEIRRLVSALGSKRLLDAFDVLAVRLSGERRVARQTIDLVAENARPAFRPVVILLRRARRGIHRRRRASLRLERASLRLERACRRVASGRLRRGDRRLRRRRRALERRIRARLEIRRLENRRLRDPVRARIRARRLEAHVETRQRSGEVLRIDVRRGSLRDGGRRGGRVRDVVGDD